MSSKSISLMHFSESHWVDGIVFNQKSNEFGKHTNLSHISDDFRFSFALLVEQFIEALAEILVHQLIPVQWLVVIIVALR